MARQWLRFNMLNAFKIIETDQLNENIISERLISIYNRNQYIDFVIDRTVDYEFLNDFIGLSNQELQSEKLFLAKPIAREDKEQIIFIRVKSWKILLKIIDEIIQQIIDQTLYETTRFLIVGWGKYQGELKDFKADFAKTIVGVNVTENTKFIFRWYDPRVQYFCTKIFPEVFLTYFLSNLKEWEFIHPKGLFTKHKMKATKFKFDYSYPIDFINYFSKIEDVNRINKYINEKKILHSRIEPTKTHQLLSFLLIEKNDISFEDINELIYWFYKLDKDLLNHQQFKTAWSNSDYDEIYKKLNSLTEIQMKNLKSELDYGG